MLKKKQRLTKSAFDKAFKTGRRSHSPSLQLIYAKEQDFHAAAVVGKKVYKTAVARNRLRRQLYGLIYRFHQHTPLSGTFIVIAKPPARETTASDMKNSLESLLIKAAGQ